MLFYNLRHMSQGPAESIQYPPIFAALSPHGRTVDYILYVQKISVQHVLVSRNQCNLTTAIYRSTLRLILVHFLHYLKKSETMERKEILNT